MASERAERVAENEDAARTRNERLGVMGVFVCECADADCRRHIQMPRERYSAIRGNAFHFFVSPGHENPDFERVVERAQDWNVVEKPDSVAHIVS